MARKVSSSRQLEIPWRKADFSYSAADRIDRAGKRQNITWKQLYLSRELRSRLHLSAGLGSALTDAE